MGFDEQIQSIQDIEELTALKEQIKNEITKNLDWEYRMELYQKVQFINACIDQLKIKK